ncbi:MAG: MarC family protein [Bacteroidota bacterium]|nr:MarC family protein [Bacteroidota bacterium]
MNVHNYLLHALTVFMGFFAMLNPLGNLPIFVDMVKNLDEKTQRKIARKSVMVAFFIIFFFCIFGHLLFRIFGITLPAFQIAGGIIVFFMGYNMLTGKESTIATADHTRKSERARIADDLAITPLGTPLLAGPGTISAAMNFVGIEKSILNGLIVVSIFGIMCVITYFLFLYGQKLFEKLGPDILKVIGRIMGLILAVIAIQLMINGVEGTISIFKQS